MDRLNTAISLISSIEPMLRNNWSSLSDERGKKYGGNEVTAEVIEQSKGRLIADYYGCYKYSCYFLGYFVFIIVIIFFLLAGKYENEHR